MKTKKELELTSDLINLIIKRLKKELKENYQGLFSVAKYLTNLYFSSEYYPNIREEYRYFIHHKAELLFVDVLKWLGNETDPMGRSKLNFKKLIKEYDEEITQIKEDIYNKWINDELKDELGRLQKREHYNAQSFIGTNIEYYKEMLEDLTRTYPKYDEKLEREFREELGLC